MLSPTQFPARDIQCPSPTCPTNIGTQTTSFSIQTREEQLYLLCNHCYHAQPLEGAFERCFPTGSLWSGIIVAFISTWAVWLLSWPTAAKIIVCGLSIIAFAQNMVRLFRRNRRQHAWNVFAKLTYPSDPPPNSLLPEVCEAIERSAVLSRYKPLKHKLLQFLNRWRAWEPDAPQLQHDLLLTQDDAYTLLLEERDQSVFSEQETTWLTQRLTMLEPLRDQPRIQLQRWDRYQEILASLLVLFKDWRVSSAEESKRIREEMHEILDDGTALIDLLQGLQVPFHPDESDSVPPHKASLHQT